MSTDVLDEKKAGWSRHCLAGNFELCEEVKFRCANARHRTEGETPDERRNRLLAEARARSNGHIAQPEADEDVETPSMLTRIVLTALVNEGGEIAHASGRAVSVLRTCCGYEGSSDSFRVLLARLEGADLIDTDRKHTRTYRVGILDAGIELIGADPSQLTKIHPPAPEPDDDELVEDQADEQPEAEPEPELLEQQHEDEEAAPESDPLPSANGPGGARPSPSATPRDPRDAKVEIVWEQPSTRTNGRYSLTEVLEAEGVFDTLKSRPGEWARVITYGSNSSASKAVTKLRKDTTIADFEWMSKRAPLIDDRANGSLLYGRYVGETGAE